MSPRCRKSGVTGLVALLVVSGAGCEGDELVVDDCFGPVALGKMPDLGMLIGDTASASLADYFGHPFGYELSYTASSTSPAVAVSISGADLMIAADEEGDYVLVVARAIDPCDESAAHSFHVSVEQPQPGTDRRGLHS